MEKLVKASKNSNISLHKKNLVYSIRKDKNIVQSSIESGIKLPYSCRSGVCGTCKARLISGEVSKNNSINHVLTQEDKNENIFLACQENAVSDSIEIEVLSPLPIQSNLYKDMTPKKIFAEVIIARQISPIVKEIGISISKNIKFIYQAGMNMEFVIPGIEPNREYSIIDSPNKNGFPINGILRFLIACHKNSKASNHIKKAIKVGDIITLYGPFGNFSLPKQNKPILALSAGTGISPILSLLQSKLKRKSNKNIMLVSSFRDRNEVLLMDEMQKLDLSNNIFSFKITLTREKPKRESRFLYGRIPNILQKIYSNLNGHNILIAGSPQFVQDCTTKVMLLGAKRNYIFSDSFNYKI